MYFTVKHVSRGKNIFKNVAIKIFETSSSSPPPRANVVSKNSNSTIHNIKPTPFGISDEVKTTQRKRKNSNSFPPVYHYFRQKIRYCLWVFLALYEEYVLLSSQGIYVCVLRNREVFVERSKCELLVRYYKVLFSSNFLMFLDA